MGELSDLLYHLTVLMVNEGIPFEAVEPSWPAATKSRGT